MVRIFKLSFLLIFLFSFLSCNGQDHPPSKKETLSNDFDQSPPFFYKMPSNLTSTDTSPGWNQQGQKILLTGIVYEVDGTTPAANVILYYYQTDIRGEYSTNSDEPLNMPKNKRGQTHGYIRGWVKTRADGKYAIYTVMPGTYPSRDEPAHVHISVREKNMSNPYYLDDFVFDNDPLLTAQRRNNMENRGGSGVIRFVVKDGLWIGERNIILGLNIPEYPGTVSKVLDSGKNVGENVTSFIPYHAYGPDKGTNACPICKYGWYNGILYFVGNNPDWPEIKKWLTFLDNESQKREKYLKVYFVYGNEKNFSKEERIAQLGKLANELQLQKIALTFVPSFTDNASDIYLNKINQNVNNTFLIYRRSRIIGKYVNSAPTQENFDKINKLLDRTANEYFKLLKPSY